MSVADKVMTLSGPSSPGLATRHDLDAYCSQKPEILMKTLGTSAAGLKHEEAGHRLAQVGRNVLNTGSEVTALGLFLNQFKNPIMLILTFATIASALLGDLVDAVIITLIVLGSALLSFVQEYSANTAAEKLKEQVKIRATVLRDGQPQSIPADEVVPGDVVLMEIINRFRLEESRGTSRVSPGAFQVEYGGLAD